MFWECLLDDWCRQEVPTRDALLHRNWLTVESLLVESLPDAEQIVTPSWEDACRREAWQAFLRDQGYEPESPAVYRKQPAREKAYKNMSIDKS